LELPILDGWSITQKLSRKKTRRWDRKKLSVIHLPTSVCRSPFDSFCRPGQGVKH